MLSAYRGSSSSSSPATSNNPVLVELSGDLPFIPFGSGFTEIVFADSPHAVLSTEGGLLVDTSGGAITITLEAAPIDGRVLNIKRITTDGAAITIARNGKLIEGAAANIIDTNTDLVNYQLFYDSGTGSWWIL